MVDSSAVSDYAAFFRAHFSATVRHVESMVGTAAEDVAQEAFLAALTSWERVARLEAPDGWVRLVARRIAWRHRHRELSRRAIESAAAGPAAAYDEALALDLGQAIQGLPDRQRAAILLYYVADRSVGDVAVILGCSESAAKVWLHRARQRLADSLLGHRGRWVTERRWDVDAIVARMRATGDGGQIETVLSEVPVDSARWALTLDSGSYLIEGIGGPRLDWGRYRVRARSLVLTPWNKSGSVVLAPTLDGGRARYSLISDTTAPTRGVPDEVYLRLLLGADTFRHDRQGEV